jgi:hypothetical protein
MHLTSSAQGPVAVRGLLAAALLAAALLAGWAPTRALARGVTLQSADRWAARTFVNDPSGRVTFEALHRHVITAGDGSTITAVAAVRRQSADGTGQIVLFFRGGRFLGWDSAFESLRLRLTAARHIVVRYGVYRGNDPFCCPSGVRRITYRWNGRRIVASGTPPLSYGRRGQRLHLARR